MEFYDTSKKYVFCVFSGGLLQIELTHNIHLHWGNIGSFNSPNVSDTTWWKWVNMLHEPSMNSCNKPHKTTYHKTMSIFYEIHLIWTQSPLLEMDITQAYILTTKADANQGP